MNIFVTGGAGFIGSHIVDKLINEGNTVTVYDNLSSGRKQFIEQHLKSDNFSFIKADLLDSKKVDIVIKGHDVVILAIYLGYRKGLIYDKPKVRAS